jgi:hypothetical protein
VNQPLGPGIASAAFASDGFYRDSSDDAAAMIFAFPEFGGSEIWGSQFPVGTNVRFLGRTGGSLNSLSGGESRARARSLQPVTANVNPFEVPSAVVTVTR